MNPSILLIAFGFYELVGAAAGVGEDSFTDWAVGVAALAAGVAMLRLTL